MASSALLKPDYLFEVSWEVCNKVGGIHTVISTKAKTLEAQFGDQYIAIGPDVYKGGENPEFIEDATMFKSWKEHALSEGLKIRVGRWNISGNPIVLLVDFSPWFTRKNEIFTDLWTRFRLDSLTGQWDYIEPALFGYAAGKVIECFYHYHLNSQDKIVAQFHEWMTGVGVLYLDEAVPQAATVFTTHATVLGRAIAGSGVAFYSLFESFAPDKVALEHNVVSKHSLEKISANNADCFTTVSDVTAKECVKFLGRKPDAITLNGFDVSILPDEQSFEARRAEARKKILSVAEGLFNQEMPADTLMVIKSGRYEYRNKGIDIFIDSLGLLNNDKSVGKNILGVIFVPAHQTGPRAELLKRIGKPDFSAPLSGEVLTHNLQGVQYDPILKEIEKVKLRNTVNDKVKIIFVPTYLDGSDGVFDFTYYDLMIGFDLAVFPSYYEPFGYTPLESIAYHIPSVTTDVSGFGTVLSGAGNGVRPGISIVKRTDNNEKDVASEISKIIFEFTKKTATEIEIARADAQNISLSFLWDKLIAGYETAWNIALVKSLARESLFRNKQQVEPILVSEEISESAPVWRTLSIEVEFPKEISALQKISKNLWWSWNYEATELFEYIDTALWQKCGGNPVLFIRTLSPAKLEELVHDKVFLEMLQRLEEQFDAYMAVPKPERPVIAYFSMEFGLSSFIKLYSGGLGILAGDHLKEASDQALNFNAVGLLYRNGYFRQKFSVSGEQLAEPDTQDFSELPLEMVLKEDGSPLQVQLFFPARTVYAQVWKLSVGRTPLFLMDTDLTKNSPEDRDITSRLYDSNTETRLKQEILLGIGGVRMLRLMGIIPDVYHCNEGHAAFISMERVYNLVRKMNLSFEEISEVVRASTLFTTHTSVPAANDMFSEELLRKYISPIAHYYNIDWDMFIRLGRINKQDNNEKFSMTYFAARMSSEINAVSRIHRRVSCRLLNPLWKNFKAGELHIGYVTNGVHGPTWLAKEWQQLFRAIFGVNEFNNIPEKIFWEKINEVPARKIWEIKVALKRNLLNGIKAKLTGSIAFRNNPRKVLSTINSLNENALIIGFARRFVTYKRSGLLFDDLERLIRITGNTNRPVQFLFAGKAHPMDQESINLIRKLIESTSNSFLEHSIIFLEDYDIDIAKLLVQGTDIWLNTPTRHTEASGTSGMKAAINGTLNFSVLDGWWAEAYNEDIGWALSEDPAYEDNRLQNELDTETIFNTLENEIIPLFFDRDSEHVPVRWTDKIKASIINIYPKFTMHRVVTEYNNKYYKKLYERVVKFKADNYLLAHNMAIWKKNVISNWNEVDVISIEMPEKEKLKMMVGEMLKIVVTLDIGSLSINDIGIEIVFSDKNWNEQPWSKEFTIVSLKGKEVTYDCSLSLGRSGSFDYAFRIFPKNKNLSSKQDFDLVKWI